MLKSTSIANQMIFMFWCFMMFVAVCLLLTILVKALVFAVTIILVGGCIVMTGAITYLMAQHNKAFDEEYGNSEDIYYD